MKGGITVAYNGVHQAYQLALAAQESSLLDAFLCSIYDAPGKWGGRLRIAFGADRMMNRRVDGLDVSRVREHPSPLLIHLLRSRLKPARSHAWLIPNKKFDRWVAAQLKESPSRVFVGVETCCHESFLEARRRRMRTVLECPGLESSFLNQLADRAAPAFGLRTARTADSEEMSARKRAEMSLADVVLVCSEFQRSVLQRSNAVHGRVEVLPLWVDSSFWQSPKCRAEPIPGPLRVVYAGGVSLRKGVPYLVEAARAANGSVALTLVGHWDLQLSPLRNSIERIATVIGPVTKPTLRKLYADQDIFVLPTLGDSFGFAAIEAMASGLPVIVSDNCGVPVPDKSWRVPAMDAGAIAHRLDYYVRNKEQLTVDSAKAIDFARRFTPQNYRLNAGKVMANILNCVE